MFDRPPLYDRLDLAAPDQVLFDEFSAILERLHPRQVGEQSRVSTGLRPGASDFGEAAQLLHVIERGYAHHQLIGDLQIGRRHRHLV